MNVSRRKGYWRAALAAVLCLGSVQAQMDRPPLAFSVEPLNTENYAGFPIPLKVTIKNLTASELVVLISNFGPPTLFFTEKGGESSAGPARASLRSVGETIPPFRRISRVVYLNTYFPKLGEGRHTIEGACAMDSPSMGAFKGQWMRKTFEIDIKSPPEGAFPQVVKQYLDMIQSPADHVRYEGCQGLILFEDERVIPHLGPLLGKYDLVDWVLPRLESFHSPAAQAALLENMPKLSQPNYCRAWNILSRQKAEIPEVVLANLFASGNFGVKVAVLDYLSLSPQLTEKNKDLLKTASSDQDRVISKKAKKLLDEKE